MRAIILAAGRGSRMGEATATQPKCLTKIFGEPLIDWQIKAFHASGIKNICVVTGYKHEKLEGYGSCQVYNSRWAETQMVASLMCASDWLESSPCIISYSDIFYDNSAVVALQDARASLAITYDPNWLELWRSRFEDPLIDAEAFEVDASGNLQNIGNRPETIHDIEGQYMGLLKLTPHAFQEIKILLREESLEMQDSIHMTGLLQKLIKSRSLKIQAIPYYGRWGEVDSQNDKDVYENWKHSG